MPLVYLSASSLLSQVEKSGQWSIVPLLQKTGIRGLEIRHELLSEQDAVLIRPIEMQNDPDFHLVYSAPIPFFDNEGRYNTGIEPILKQAGRLQCDIVKFPLGAYQRTDSNLLALKKALSAFTLDFPNTIVTVENDQTKEGGRLEPLRDFLFACERENMHLFMTFDIGNWLYVHDDPVVAAHTFSRFVRYIHVKQVKQQNDGFATMPISAAEGPYQELLMQLPGNVPRCIEFPILEDECEVQLVRFVKLLST